jgi:hypothetical protein
MYRLIYGQNETQTFWAQRWRRSWWLLVVLLIIGQLGRWQVNDTLAIYGFEIVMALQVIWIFGYRWKNRSSGGGWPTYWWPMAGLIGAMLWSLLVNYPQLKVAVIPASFYLWRFLLITTWWLSLAWVKQWRWLALPYRRVLLWIGAGWAVGGLGQYLLSPDMRWLFQFGWDDHYYRAVGLLFDPGFLGLMMVLTLTLLEYQRGRYWKIGYGLAGMTLLLTYSRASYLVYAVAMILVAGSKHSVKLGVSRLLFIGIGILLLPRPGGEGVRLERTYSVETRIESSVSAFDLFTQSPWWGKGYNAYRYLMQKTHPLGFPVHPSAPDNSWLFILATMGLVGLGATIWWLGAIVTKHRNQPEVWTSIAVVAVHALTNNSLFYVFVMIWLGLLVNDPYPKKAVKERIER